VSDLRARDLSEAPVTRGRVGVDLLEHGLAFLASSAAAFGILLFIGAFENGISGGALLAFPYAIVTASGVALVVSAAVGVLHAIERVVSRRWAFVASSAALVAAVTPIVLPIAGELAAGDGVAAVLPERWGKPIAWLAFVVCALALFVWHRAVARAAVERRRTRTFVAIALVCVGLASAASSASLLSSGLRAYAFLVDLVALAFVIVVGTLVFALVSRARSIRRAFTGAWLVVLGFAIARIVAAPIALAEGREALVPTSQVAARLDRILWSPPRSVSLRIDASERVRCEEPIAPSRSPAFALPGQSPRNLLLISIDALRSDAVTWERDGRRLMPNLAAFAEGSVYAPSAVSTYPATIFAVESALTGLHPSRVLFAPAPPRTIVSRIAAQMDVRSAHLPSAHWFRKPAVKTLLLDGLSAHRHGGAASQVRAVVGDLSRARSSGESYAIWAHFYDPHHPYRTHSGFEHGEGARNRYASEIAYLDAQLGPLFRYLEESGAYDDTLVVLFADHGEALGERGYFGHHVYLDGYMTDVPLVVRAPGVAPRVVEGVVELTDVAATIAHFFGKALDAGSAGASLLLGDPPRDRVAIAEAFPIRGDTLFDVANRPVRTLDELDARMEQIHDDARRYSPKVAIVSRDFRLVVDRHSGLRELYRRGAPSSEQPNVAHRHPRELARLTSQLGEWHEATGRALYCAVRDVTAAAPPMPASASGSSDHANRP
jgi:choline-sulfatase